MQEVLICRREDCRRGVYICLPATGQSSFSSYWYCYAGHEQDPNRLSYAPLNQVDVSTPDNAKHWAEYPTLDHSFVALEDFCLQMGFDPEELDEADWQAFTGVRNPDWMITHPCHEEPEAWRTHRANYETYHVYIGGRTFFFWIRNDLADIEAAYASVPWFWHEDEGERRNGDIFIIRNGAGQILHRMESTRPGAIQARLSSAYALLRGDPLYERVEVHKNTFDPTSLYEGKPLAVVTRDDLTRVP